MYNNSCTAAEQAILSGSKRQVLKLHTEALPLVSGYAFRPKFITGGKYYVNYTGKTR